jgi:D-arabinose 1-dehydrogenase-like Zn-dependent alcohol dehydrogenase
MNRHVARLFRDDRGSVSAAMAIGTALAIVLLAFVTTVHGLNDAQSRADGYAAEAARAAANAVNTRGATVTIDTAGAQTAARHYLAAAGVTGTVTITGPATVQVTVTVDRPAVFTLFGPAYHATATKNAVLVAGSHA